MKKIAISIAVSLLVFCMTACTVPLGAGGIEGALTQPNAQQAPRVYMLTGVESFGIEVGLDFFEMITGIQADGIQIVIDPSGTFEVTVPDIAFGSDIEISTKGTWVATSEGYTLTGADGNPVDVELRDSGRTLVMAYPDMDMSLIFEM